MLKTLTRHKYNDIDLVTQVTAVGLGVQEYYWSAVIIFFLGLFLSVFLERKYWPEYAD